MKNLNLSYFNSVIFCDHLGFYLLCLKFKTVKQCKLRGVIFLFGKSKIQFIHENLLQNLNICLKLKCVPFKFLIVFKLENKSGK